MAFSWPGPFESAANGGRCDIWGGSFLMGAGGRHLCPQSESEEKREGSPINQTQITRQLDGNKIGGHQKKPHQIFLKMWRAARGGVKPQGGTNPPAF